MAQASAEGPASNNTDSETQRRNTIIIASVCGAMGLIIIAVTVLVCYVRRRKAKPYRSGLQNVRDKDMLSSHLSTSFSRKFKGWYRVAPSKMRQDLRSGGLH